MPQSGHTFPDDVERLLPFCATENHLGTAFTEGESNDASTYSQALLVSADVAPASRSSAATLPNMALSVLVLGLPKCATRESQMSVLGVRCLIALTLSLVIDG